MAEEPLLVRDFMSREIVALDPSATVGDALARMEETGVHGLPVMANSSLKGWVSYDTILRRNGVSRSAKVASLMEPPAKIPKTTEISAAAELMIQSNLRAVPVVDDKGMVVGVLSRTDLLQAAERVPALAKLPLEGVMTRDLETATEGSPVDEAAHRLRELHINQLLVVDESGRLRGYVGKKEVLRATTAEHNADRPGRRSPSSKKAERVEIRAFVRSAPALPRTGTMGEAIALMRREATTFVAVVDDGYAVGVLSRANVVERLASLRPSRTGLCQVTGLHGQAEAGDLDRIYALAQATLKKVEREFRVEFLNLHYKVYKSKAESEGDQKYALTAHLGAAGHFFVQKADDWDLERVTRQALDYLERRVMEQKELRLEKRKGPPRRRAAFYTASPG